MVIAIKERLSTLMDTAREGATSQRMNVQQGRKRTVQNICFIFFSGLCTIVDATTTALGVSSNLAFEVNPPVAWRVANPALFIATEAGWFFITIAAFQLFNHMQQKYNVRKPFLWNSYIIVVAVCGLRLLFGLYNIKVIMSAFWGIT